MKKVFIDGSAGTTGLRIKERLSERRDLELIILPDEIRKDPNARRDALNSSDVAFLCLPDAAAIEAVSLVENPNTVVIDTSTAHRCNPDWLYGFPEIVPHTDSKRIANPGCHASGFVSLVAPLVQRGIIAADAKLCAFSLTGFSGGGKKMIAGYAEVGITNEESGTENSAIHNSSFQLHNLFLGGRQYALDQTHKHLPEMKKYCGLEFAPVFSPIVVPHLSGMEVTVQLHGVSLAAVKDCYRDYYNRKIHQGVRGISPVSLDDRKIHQGARGIPPVSLDDRKIHQGVRGISPVSLDDRKIHQGVRGISPVSFGVVRYAETIDEAGFISSAALTGRDDLIVSAYGNDDRVILVSLFDNLGKGASGSAIQNMNLALGCSETEGLVLG